jgi:uncharacterized protein Yka (UPF0111/DUF47 family)
MGSEGGIRPRWLWGSIFEPATDFYDLLNQHAKKVLEGMEALHDWVSTDNRDERCQRVRDLENEADVLKLEMGKKLFDSFVTPFDREDIFELINRMDEVINAAKSTVREIEAYNIDPIMAPYVTEMIIILVEGTTNLVNSIGHLKDKLSECSTEAVLARKAENRFTKAYRQSMTELLRQDDIKSILRAREVYRSLAIIAERIDLVGERLQHAVIKMS